MSNQHTNSKNEEEILNNIASFLLSLLHTSENFGIRISYEDLQIDVKVPNQELNISYIEEKLEEHMKKNNIPLELVGISVRAMMESESEEAIRLYLLISFAFC